MDVLQREQLVDNIDSSKNLESHSMIRMPDYAVWVTVFLSFAPAIVNLTSAILRAVRLACLNLSLKLEFR